MNDENHQEAEHFGHVVSVKLLFVVFVALVSLTIITVVINDFDLGQMDIWVAMGIATLKGSLVCLFFMHMYWEKGFNVVAFFSSLFFVSLFIGFTLMDTGAYRESIDIFPEDKRPDPRVPRTKVGFAPVLPSPTLVGTPTPDPAALIHDVRI